MKVLIETFQIISEPQKPIFGKHNVAYHFHISAIIRRSVIYTVATEIIASEYFELSYPVVQAAWPFFAEVKFAVYSIIQDLLAILLQLIRPNNFNHI